MSSQTTAAVSLFVSPTGSGITSPEAAIDAVERLREDPAHTNEPVTITLSPGIYYMKRLVIPADAGPLTIAAPPGQAVILSAGSAIQNWKADHFNGHRCWSAEIPAVQMGIWNFHELWVSGKRATRARYPSHGYLTSIIPPQNDKTWNIGQNWFGYKPGDLPDELPADTEAVVLNRWVEGRLSMLTVDPTAHLVHSTRITPFQLEPGDIYWLEGAPQWLNQPGDWYLDRAAGKLYYMPRPGEVLATITAVAPRLPALLEIHGAHDVTFRGITFSHAEWNLPESPAAGPPQVGGSGQAAVDVPAAVSVDHAQNCRFYRCTFDHIGDYGLALGTGCRKNIVDHCIFTDLGAGGIKIGDQNPQSSPNDLAFGNIVSDCRITDGGHVSPSACGIWVGESYDNHIEHNEIADLYYSGISIGWTWGLGPSLARGNIVEGNLIHDLGKKLDGDGPILSDMGGVYTLGVQPGTIIRNNVFHDIAGRIYGGWGIYLDNGSSNITVEKNLVYRTTHGGFHQNYGQNNLVTNNIFALGRDVQIARTESDPTNTFTFTRNIVYLNSGVFIVTGPEGLTFDGNLYDCTDPTFLKFGSRSWKEWRARGMDRKTILAGAEFRNMKTDDYTPSAAARSRIGFEPLEIDHVGPR